MDDIDRKIINRLQEDGRASLENLAETTGYTSMGTKKRLQKLLTNGTMKVNVSLNPQRLKLLPAMVMLEMESAQAMHDLIERFKNCPRVVHIFKTMGGYNLIALVVAENQDTLESISVEKCSLRSSPGIRRSEFYPISDIHFSPFLTIRTNLANRERQIAPCNVDCHSCGRYGAQKCVGCPSTCGYKGIM